MTRRLDARSHPSQFEGSILLTAAVAMATWWGLGLPYSLFSWLLDPQQLRWVLICYAWEVPVAGVLGPVLIPLIWYRDIRRRWDATFADPQAVDPAAAAALERSILDFPMRVAGVVIVTSVAGYGIGALQVRLFAEAPMTEVLKIGALGLAMGFTIALFAFLYLESLLTPLLRRFAMLETEMPPTGRRLPLYVKVFACALVTTLTALLLLGTLLYSRGERVLEEEVGRRVLGEARQLAVELAADGGVGHARDPAWWRPRQAAMQLGPSGYAYVVDDVGAVVGGTARVPSLDAEGFRASVAKDILGAREGERVDRVYTQRIVAFARVGDTPLRVVTVTARRDFDAELHVMFRRGLVVFVTALLLALAQGFLFSRRLTYPIEVLRDRAGSIALSPHGPWPTVPVRTNDEVGELATAFNRMIARLEDARTELERRITEATRNVTTLYEVTRTTASTLEIRDVLKLVAEKTLDSLALSRLVVLWCPPDLGDVVDGYAAASDGPGKRLEIDQPLDLAGLCAPDEPPRVTMQPALPRALSTWLAAPRTLSLPLVFKDELLGVILAAIDDETPPPDLEMAAALAHQAAAAIANAGLFETIRQKEAELRKLSEARAELQEESLRTMSRELHDGLGQALTVINLDLGMVERGPELTPDALRARLHEVRDQVMDILQHVRTMSQVLRPPMLDFGLVPTIHWLVEKFTGSTQIAVDVHAPPEETRLPSEIELLLYRVTQEALTNVARHAQARHVRLELLVHRRQVVLIVADDGVGFDAERLRRTPSLAGVGLLGMRERVAYYQGTLDIRSRPHAGVRIVVTIPLRAEADGSASPARALGG